MKLSFSYLSLLPWPAFEDRLASLGERDKNSQNGIQKWRTFDNDSSSSSFIDNAGVWRCGGWLTKADLPFMAQHPVLLDSQHPLTGWIILDAHAVVKHNGVSETLAEIRSRYWIVHGRSLVKMFLRPCVIYRHFEGRARYPPPPPPLPSFKVREAPAFTYTGVDYAGPF